MSQGQGWLGSLLCDIPHITAHLPREGHVYREQHTCMVQGSGQSVMAQCFPIFQCCQILGGWADWPCFSFTPSVPIDCAVSSFSFGLIMLPLLSPEGKRLSDNSMDYTVCSWQLCWIDSTGFSIGLQDTCVSVVKQFQLLFWTGLGFGQVPPARFVHGLCCGGDMICVICTLLEPYREFHCQTLQKWNSTYVEYGYFVYIYVLVAIYACQCSHANF